MEKNMQKPVKRTPIIYTLIYGMIVIIGAQLRLPMLTDGFVISAGVILFALFMLLLDEFATLQVMCISAIGVMITRAFAEAGGPVGPEEIWETGMPEFAFYLVYGVVLYLLFRYLKAEGRYAVAFAALIIPDFTANLVEMYIRIGADPENAGVVVPLLIVAVIRSAIILAIYAFVVHYGLPVVKRFPETGTTEDNKEKLNTEERGEDSLMTSAADDAAALYSKLQQAGASHEIIDKMKALMEDIEKGAEK